MGSNQQTRDVFLAIMANPALFNLLGDTVDNTKSVSLLEGRALDLIQKAGIVVSDDVNITEVLNEFRE